MTGTAAMSGWRRACLRALVAGLVWLAAYAPVWAAQDGSEAVLRKGENRYLLWQQLLLIEEGAKPLDPDSLWAKQTSDFKTLPRRHYHYGAGLKTYWARFSIRNADHDTRAWTLVHEQTSFDHIRLFVRKKGGRWREIEGLRDAYKKEFLGGFRNQAFYVELGPGERLEFAYKIRSQSYMRFPLVLYETERFHHDERVAQLGNGILLGVPIVLVLYMGLFWLVSREPSLPSFIGMMGFEAAGAAWVGGMWHEILPMLPTPVLNFIGFSGYGLAFFFAYTHVVRFLDLDVHMPRLARGLLLLRWVFPPLLVFEVAGLDFARKGMTYAWMLSSLLLLLLALVRARAGHRYANAYALAWFTYLVSAAFMWVNLAGHLAPNTSNIIMFAQGSLVSLIFAYAVVGRVRDVEKMLREKAEESSSRFDLAARGSSVGIFDWVREPSGIFLSTQAQRILGLESCVGTWRGVLRCLPREARHQLLGALRIPREAQRFACEITVAPLGEPRWLYVSAAIERDDDGRVSRLCGSISDVTGWRELERERGKNAALAEFRSLFDRAPVGLYRATSEGEILHANAALARFHGYADLDEAGNERSARWHAEPRHYLETMLRLRRSGSIENIEYDAVRWHDGQPRRVVENLRMVEDRGDILVYEGALQDISERYLMERQLEDAKERAEQANLARYRFFAAANHDLRQPLQSLGLYLAMAVRQASGPLAETLRRMRMAYQSLTDFLNGLLDLSRLEAETLVPERRPFPVGPLLAQLAEEYGEQAKIAGLEFRQTPCEDWVDSDPLLLERILRNLLVNAIRYTRQGRVMLGCVHVGNKLEIMVVDTGIGIAEADQERVFGEFVRVDGSTGEGVGLGLSIVRRMARLLDHELGFWSKPGVGTSISLRVPLAGKTGEPIDASRTLRNLAGARLLVIDDEEAVRQAIAVALTAAGAEVRLAASPEEAQRRIADGFRPQLLIADYRVSPGQNGIDVVAALRISAGELLPALLVTGDTARESLDAIRKSGLPVLHKPVTEEALLEKVGELLARNAASSPEPVAAQ